MREPHHVTLKRHCTTPPSLERDALCAYNVDRRVQSQLIVHVSIAAPLPLPMQLGQSLTSLLQPTYKYAHLIHLSNLIGPLPSINLQLAMRIRSRGV